VRAWAPDGVDVVVDPIGAAALADNQRALAVDGRIIVIGLLGGRRATLDLGRLLVKRQKVVGTVLRSRSKGDKAVIVRSIAEHVWPRITDGELEVGVTRVVRRDEVDDAHAAMAANRVHGKWVIAIDET